MNFLRNNRAALALMALGGVFVAVGLWQGEAQTVLRKAVHLCMECVGLG